MDAPDPRIGSVLGGRYILEELIGEGGMASVYRARHTLVDRPFAVKILRGELARDPTLRERLRREGRSAAALTHPNIVEIYDFGTTDDGAPYLVMELLTNGKTIRHILREEGAPPLGLTIEIAIQIARGLARAHDFGVVHRDLKPENVFVLEAADGRPLVKIVDFGIARTHQDPHLTSLGEILGTPQYMAPERATSRDVGPSADLYSFGVMLYELVTGHLPFQSNNPTGFVLKHMYEEPPPLSQAAPGCPELLASLITQLLKKTPAERPVDAHQVLAQLMELAPADDTRTVRLSWVGKESPALTSTLDGWSSRLALFLRVLEQLTGTAPKDSLDTYTELRASLERLRALQQEGLQAQQAIDLLEKEGREGSERLGHAVHVLGGDLSRMREQQRKLRTEADERKTAAESLGASFREHAQRLIDFHAATLDQLDARVIEEARTLADSGEAWEAAGEAARAAADRAEALDREVGDVGFQIEELRKQLRQLEASVQSRGRSSQATLARTGTARRELEAKMLELSERFVAPLRDRPEVAELLKQDLAAMGSAPEIRA